jgi:hypothetical protein
MRLHYYRSAYLPAVNIPVSSPRCPPYRRLSAHFSQSFLAKSEMVQKHHDHYTGYNTP